MYRIILAIISICFVSVVFAKQADPHSFIINNGQITDQHRQPRTDIDAKVQADGVTLFIGDGQLHYQWQNMADSTHTTLYRLDVTLLNANTDAKFVLEEPTDFYEQYYTATMGEQGITAAGYSKLTYKNIYPNIDWVLYTHGGHLKYDFVVHDGGDAAKIQLQYNGADNILLQDGRLQVHTPLGSITEDAPYTYSAATGATINSKYQLNGNVLSFELADDEARQYVIDPSLSWASYYGGTGGDTGYAVAMNDFGEVYLCGTTNSSTNIATTGAYQTTVGNNYSGFVLKVKSNGQKQWATYYGDSTQLQGIACDDFGNIYLSGKARANGLATSGAFKTNFSGPYNKGDALLVKLNNAGQRKWATYYGDTTEEWGMTVACDKAGNVILGGTTRGGQNLATSGAHDTVCDGENVFVVKFDSTGSRQWATYYGGYQTHILNGEKLQQIACDKDGDIIIVGWTNHFYVSNNPLVTAGAHQTFGFEGGFIAKFTPAGNRIWGTLYGNPGSIVSDVAFDDDKNIYVSGHVAHPNISYYYYDSLNATPGTHKTSLAPQYFDAFLAKFTTNGVRVWGSFYGGAENDYGLGIAVNPAGTKVYLYGSTKSDTGIATTGAFKTTRGGLEDMFIAEFDSTGNRTWGTYYGGSQQDAKGYTSTGDLKPGGLCTGCTGKMYVASYSASNSGIATGGAQTSFGGQADAVFMAIDIDTVAYIVQPFADTLHCPGDTLRIPIGTNLLFNTGNTFTIEMSDSAGSFSNPVNIGAKAALFADTITCVIPKNTPPGNDYRIRISSSAPARYSCVFKSLHVKEAPYSLIATHNTPICSGDTLHLYASTSSTASTNWSWSGGNNFSSTAKDSFIANAVVADSGKYIVTATTVGSSCSFKDTITAVVKQTPQSVAASSNSPVCETKTIGLSASSSTSGVSWSWTGPGTYSSNAQNPTVSQNANSSHAGTYKLIATLNGCSAEDSATVTVLPKPARPTAGSNSPVCVNQDLELSATSITNANYHWYGPALFSDTTQNATRYQTQFAHAGTYYVYVTINGCVSDTDSVAVVVNINPSVTVFPSPGTTVCKGEEVTFTTLANNAGASPTYKWLVNNTPTGSTGTIFKSKTLNNGDIVTCEMMSTGTCLLPFTDTSSKITMVVQQLLTPQVSITANPNHTLFPNEPVTFTATPTDAGNNPTYQWTRNGTPVGGATGAQWGANANFMSDGDEICAIVYSDYACPSPDSAKSNCITVKINVGVSNISKDSDINIYPNPVTNELHIEGATEGTEVTLYDVTGRTVYRNTITTNTHHINTRQLSAGSYVLVITDKNGKRLQAKVNKW